MYLTYEFMSNCFRFLFLFCLTAIASGIISTNIEDTPDVRLSADGSKTDSEHVRSGYQFQRLPTEIITRLPTRDSVIALTFDACESVTPSYIDTSVLQYIIRSELPATLFISGRFAERNKQTIAEISALPFIEIENHSYDHVLHMERLPLTQVFTDVERARKTLDGLSPAETRFFRFPGGHYDTHSLLAVSQMKYQVVHWSYPSGDADPAIPEKRIIEWNVSQARPGSILIFHINGRGYKTRRTLPVIVDELKKRGYRFALLKDYL